MENLDPENLESFKIPDSILNEIYELTGESSSNRGYLLACVGQDGRPFIYSRSETQVIELGIRKALEQYLTELEDTNSLDYFPGSDQDLS
ncbi:hypothetical protein OAA62_00080 [bacterium]|nr:hypothetical protein [bacterium]